MTARAAASAAIADPPPGRAEKQFQTAALVLLLCCVAARPFLAELPFRTPTVGTALRADRRDPEALPALIERLVDMRALQVWRSAHLPRTVLGTCCIRRVMTSTGPRRTLGVDAETRRPRQLRNIECSWARVFPWEIIRDPAANDPDPNHDETIIGVEKPRTVEWIKRNYGVSLDTECTYGRLVHFQNELRRVAGWKGANHSADSRAKAVLVSEWYFQDADAEEEWPHQLIA